MFFESLSDRKHKGYLKLAGTVVLHSVYVCAFYNIELPFV